MTIQSHLHNGRWSWGAKEDCEQCMKAEKLMAEAREDFKVNYAPLLETTVVDADGIIRDVPMFKGEPIKVTEQLYDGSYEAYVGDPDPEGYRRAFGRTPVEAIENFHDLYGNAIEISTCCGAQDRPTSIDGPSYEDVGCCPECGDHTEFITVCDECSESPCQYHTARSRADRDPVNSLISTMALGWVITLLCGVAIGYYIGAAEASAMVLEAVK